MSLNQKIINYVYGRHVPDIVKLYFRIGNPGTTEATYEYSSTLDEDVIIVDASPTVTPEPWSESDRTINTKECPPTGPITEQNPVNPLYDNSCVVFPVYSSYTPVQFPSLSYTNCFGLGKHGLIINSGSSDGYTPITMTNRQTEKLHSKLLDDQEKQPFGQGFRCELPKLPPVFKPISELHVYHSRVSTDNSSPYPSNSKPNGFANTHVSNDSEFEPRAVSATGAFNSLRSGSGYSSELQSALNGDLDLEGMDDLEKEMAFDLRNHPPHSLKRGSTMSNFTYLLLDPRVTRNLPGRAKSLDDRDVISTFVRSIFYVGKGQGRRSYAHLRTAHAQFFKSRSGFPTEVSGTLQHILNIWTSGHGVVSVPLFHNTVAIEAHTREACMIEAIGLSNLTNRRRGVYYGQSRSWTRETKCMMGVYLLKRALQIFICEGERPIGPWDIS